jgi:hypothetical protein
MRTPAAIAFGAIIKGMRRAAQPSSSLQPNIVGINSLLLF